MSYHTTIKPGQIIRIGPDITVTAAPGKSRREITVTIDAPASVKITPPPKK